MTPQTQADALALRALMATSWTQGALARDAEGHVVSWRSPKAVRFCLVGGIERVLRDRATDGSPMCGAVHRWRHLHDSLGAFMGEQDLSTWNDAPGRTHADVLALIDRAMGMKEA